LESFIKKYVQCYSCGNPETVVKVKRECISLKCKACGFVSQVDPLLRLNGFIIKNPPDNTLSKAEKKVKKAEKERLKGLMDDAVAGAGEKDDKKKKKKKSSSSKKKDEADEKQDGKGDESLATDDVEESDDDNDGDDVVWMTDTSEDAMKRRAAEQLSSATAAMVTQGNVEAEREEQKRREQKARKKEEEEEEAARQRAAEEEAKRLAADAAAKLKVKDPSSAVRDLVSTNASVEDVEAAVKEVPGGPAVRMRVLYESLFASIGKDEKVSNAVTAKHRYLDPHSSDASGQLAQLVAAEHLLGVTLHGRAREAPLVLKALYDADLVEEDLILAWYRKTNAGGVLDVPESAAKEVRAAAKPFVEWLEEASDSEEDDEDVEI